jgi:outer membrane murein-binding lipoprotein Lpp
MKSSALLGMTPAEWGGLLLVVGILLHFIKKFVRFGVIAAMVGVCLLGGGLLSQMLVKGARMLSHLTDSVAAGKLLGVGIPGLLVVVLIILVVNDLHKKGSGTTGKRTLVLGIALAACLVAGVSSFSTLNQAPRNLQTTVSTVSTGG